MFTLERRPADPLHMSPKMSRGSGGGGRGSSSTATPSHSSTLATTHTQDLKHDISKFHNFAPYEQMEKLYSIQQQWRIQDFLFGSGGGGRGSSSTATPSHSSILTTKHSKISSMSLTTGMRFTALPPMSSWNV